MASRAARAALDIARYRRYLASIDDEVFTLPAEPPPAVSPTTDIFYVRAGTEESGPKEHEDILLRRVPRDVAMRFRASAGGRGMTHARYLAALVELHREMRELADAGDARLAGELDRLGLSTVSV